MTINIDKDNLLNFFSEITDNKSELTYVKNLINPNTTKFFKIVTESSL